MLNVVFDRSERLRILNDADEVPAEVRNAPAAYSLFAALFAVFIFFHQGQWSYWKVTPWHVVVSLAAVLVLFMPQRVLTLGLLAGSVLCTFFVELPWVSNHWMLAAFLCLSILSAMAYNLVKRGKIEAGQLYLDFAPIMRWQLVIVYFFTVFHKVNKDFLDPKLSCAVDHYHNLSQVVPFLPTGNWTAYAAIYGTLVVETLMFMMLAIPRTRVLGVLLAMVFHYALAINGFPNFSALAFAMMMLFLPVTFPQDLARKWNDSFVPLWRGRIQRNAWGGLWQVGFCLAIAGIGVVAYLAYHAKPLPIDFVREPWRFGRNNLSLLLHSAWKFYGVLVMVIVIWTVYGKPFTPTPRALKPATIWFWILPALVFLNGIGPYLGLKTETSFSMFSNLRTEMREENHVLIRKNLYLLPHQNDVVSMVYSTDFNLNRVARLGHQVPFWELKSYVSRKKDANQGRFSLAYLKNGNLVTITDASTDPIFAEHIPWWKRKLLFYRTIRLGQANSCDH